MVQDLTMKGMTYVILFLCIYTVSVSALYNSNKRGAICEGTRNPNGTCSPCNADREGYNCAIISSQINASPCDGNGNTCENGGTCYNDTGTAKCLCMERYTGANCTVEVYELICNVDSMEVTVNTAEEGYPGYLYVLDHETEAGCFTTNDPPAFTVQNNACGGVTVADNGAKSMSTILLQTQDVTTTVDELITWTCGTGNSVNKTAAIAQVSFDPITNLPPVNKGNAPKPSDVSYEITASGSAITGPVVLGTQVTATFDLTDLGKQNFAAIRVESCDVENANSSDADGYLKKKMIEESCPSDLEFVMEPFVVDDTEISFDFQVFQLGSSTELFMTCEIKVCEVASDCNPVNCTDGSQGYGRKKREVEQSETRLMTQRLEILDPLRKAAETIEELAKDQKACYQTWEMTATVVALAVALVIVLFICVILIVKAILSKRRPSNYKEDVSETASTAHFPHLPTIVSDKA